MTDPFDHDDPEAGIARDRWGRPLIIPPGGGKPIAYVRASSLSKAIEDMHNLAKWQQRMVVTGLCRREDLLDMARVVLDDKDKLNGVCEDALEAGGATVARNRGTALHGFTELVDRGGDMSDVPAQHRADVQAYLDTLARFGLEPVSIETFVVDDELEVAGTFDRLLRHRPTGRLIIGDLKTGKDAGRYGLGHSIQLSSYAHGSLYNPETGERSELGANRKVGVVIALQAGTAVCELHKVNLTTGREYARLAVAVREARKDKGLIKPWDLEAAS